MKSLGYDPRTDDVHLCEDEEPKATSTDNCMREGIELQPQPMVNLGNFDIDFSNHSRTLEAKSIKSKLSNKRKKSHVGPKKRDSTKSMSKTMTMMRKMTLAVNKV